MLPLFWAVSSSAAGVKNQQTGGVCMIVGEVRDNSH